MNKDLPKKWIIHKVKVAFLSLSPDLKEINYQHKAWYLHICTWPIRDSGAEETVRGKLNLISRPELLLAGLISENRLRAFAEEHLGQNLYKITILSWVYSSVWQASPRTGACEPGNRTTHRIRLPIAKRLLFLQKVFQFSCFPLGIHLFPNLYSQPCPVGATAASNDLVEYNWPWWY